MGPAGPQGPIGLTGATGPAGADGAVGPAGPQGPIGLTGATGATGPQGPIGLTGATGATGPAGPQGPIGLTGATGPQGPIGLTGPIGPTGAVGPTGPAGPQGPIGLTGPAGPQGPAGLMGPIGPMGPMGPAGPSTFSAITSSTNTIAAMTVGSGASLLTAGTGTIAATSLSGPFGIPVSAVVATSETTTSTAYTDLTTLGPSVTVTVSSTGKALVTLTSSLSNTNNNRLCFAGFAVTGATVVPASDAQAILHTTSGPNSAMQLSATYLVTGLNAGSNTLTAKYRASANTCGFANRNIIVIPY